jgi:hypothetical protein
MLLGWHCMEVIWESEFAYSGKSIAGVSSVAMNLELTVLESDIWNRYKP